MKYYIRKTESARVAYANKPIELDPEEFKNLENNPYTGNEAHEFLEYIYSLRWDAEAGDFPEDLDFETQQKLEELFQGEMKEIYNSASDVDESFLELGEPNEKYRKTGGFDVHVRTEKN
jgi:hypothetical protein